MNGRKFCGYCSYFCASVRIYVITFVYWYELRTLLVLHVFEDMWVKITSNTKNKLHILIERAARHSGGN